MVPSSRVIRKSAGATEVGSINQLKVTGTLSTPPPPLLPFAPHEALRIFALVRLTSVPLPTKNFKMLPGCKPAAAPDKSTDATGVLPATPRAATREARRATPLFAVAEAARPTDTEVDEFDTASSAWATATPRAATREARRATPLFAVAEAARPTDTEVDEFDTASSAWATATPPARAAHTPTPTPTALAPNHPYGVRWRRERARLRVFADVTAVPVPCSSIN